MLHRQARETQITVSKDQSCLHVAQWQMVSGHGHCRFAGRRPVKYEIAGTSTVACSRAIKPGTGWIGQFTFANVAYTNVQLDKQATGENGEIVDWLDLLGGPTGNQSTLKSMRDDHGFPPLQGIRSLHGSCRDRIARLPCGGGGHSRMP